MASAQLPAVMAAPAEIQSTPVTHEPAAHPEPQGGFMVETANFPALPPADATVKAANLHLAAPLSSDRWGQSFGDQVLWMAHKEVQTASLTINPPELGPVKIELQLNDAQAVASFSSVQPEVRKAIEDALPALKTLFAEAGLDLRHVDVGSGNAHTPYKEQSRPSSGKQSYAGQPAESAIGLSSLMTTPSEVVRTHGLLDTFA